MDGFIGRSVPRVEDQALLTGRGTFVADVRPQGCLEAAFVRSSVAHAHVRRVETSPARAVPRVVGAWSAADLDLAPMGFPPRTEAPAAMARPPLATERVRYVGDPVAVVVAEDRYAAEDGVDAVLLDLEPLEAILDPRTGADPAATKLFDGAGNVASVREVGGPVDDAVARAPVVVVARYHIDRVAPSSLETHGIVVDPRAGGIDVWCSHQAPHRLRGVLARVFEMEPAAVRVRSPDVGGAFGAKSQIFPEYLVVARLALDLGRPVRWIEDRREAFFATTHGRGQYQTVTLAADEDGKLQALRLEIDADIGAYPHTGEFVPSMSLWVSSGCYEIPRIHARSRAVVTNKTPTASYRGAGRPEAAFAVERTMDLLARHLDLDPAELRRRNFVPPYAFPYASATGALYDSGDYGGSLAAALDLADYESFRAEQARRRTAGGDPIGIGICSYIERSGGQLGSSEFGAVEVWGDGWVVARSGTSSQGQGHLTSLAQIVATIFEVPLEQVDVRAGDTAEVAKGTGTFGSRSIQVGGGALYEAAMRVRAEGLTHAARLFETRPELITYARGAYVSGEHRVSLHEVARAAGGIRAEEEFAPPQAFPFGTHVAVVEVDAGTGRVRVVRLVSVDDCGIVVNPAIVREQSIGSMVQGLGQALFEKVDYSQAGIPLATSFFTYALPTAASVPQIVHEDRTTPNPNVALGTKGAGESGCIGTPPAIVNAVADALGDPRLALDMPLLPERVWRTLRAQVASAT